MQTLHTERLAIRPFSEDDAAFILALVNDADWLRFIGDRGVRSLDDARRYLRDGPLAMYPRHGFGLCCVERLIVRGSAPDTTTDRLFARQAQV